MKYQLRDYQQQASNAAVSFFLDTERKGNAIIVLATGGGKSLIIADIAYRLKSDVLVFNPSKEITQQNYAKMKSYGVECSMYSASVGEKVISKITFATIGSVKNYPELFSHFKYVIIDECHYVNSKKGLYKDFIKVLGCKVLGLTATPYRLETEVDMDWKTKKFNSATSYLKMLTDYHKPIFSDIIYNIDAGTLLHKGFLSKLKYYNLPPKGWDEGGLFKNTTGSDYTDSSVRFMQKKVDFERYLVSIVRRLLNPKDGNKRKGILVFTRFVEEAKALSESVEGGAYISGDMTKANRERILKEFEEGKIKVLANAGVLIVGYDRPDLDTVVLASPTLSLARYYQEIGRAIRLHPSKKEGWIVDVVGNFRRFGRVEELKLSKTEKDTWCITSNGRQLTD